MGSIVSMMSSTKLLRVTATGPSTHVVEVRGFSKLREECHRGDKLYSQTFTVDGLDWKVCCIPDGNGDDQGYMGVYVDLATEAAVAWARVKIGLVDWTTGRAVDTFYPDPALGDDDDPVLFDAESDLCFNSGTGKLASWEEELRGSHYLRDDCLKIECVINVYHSQLAFPDPPAPRFTPRHVKVTGELGSHEGADVLIHAGADAHAEPIPAHSSMLEAYAPRFLKKHNLGRRRRPKTAPAAAAAMRVDVDDMPRQTMEALLQFVYTGTLPVVDGLSADGYRDMFRHLRRAGERYGMRRLSAICDRILCCNSVGINSAAMLTMADRHGFRTIEEACLEFASTIPRTTTALRSGARDMCAWRLSLYLVRAVWKYILSSSIARVTFKLIGC